MAHFMSHKRRSLRAQRVCNQTCEFYCDRHKMFARIFEILLTYLISRAIYFRDIREADVLAKINRRKNLLLPLQLRRQARETRRKLIAANRHSIDKTRKLVAAKINKFTV